MSNTFHAAIPGGVYHACCPCPDSAMRPQHYCLVTANCNPKLLPHPRAPKGCTKPPSAALNPLNPHLSFAQAVGLMSSRPILVTTSV